MTSRRFVLFFLILVIAGFVLFQATMTWLNPFGLFPWQIQAENPKPMLTHGEVFKTWMLEKLQPDYVVFGNSRAEAGFAVTTDQTGYANGVNAAVSGGTFPEIGLLVRHALAVTEPKAFLWVVDPNSFTQAKIRPTFQQLGIGHRLNTIESFWRKMVFHSDWNYLWNEFRTRLYPIESENVPYLDGNRGLRGEASMRRQTLGYGGSRNASLVWERILSNRDGAFENNTSANLRLYQELLVQACQRGIRVVTLIPPIHARMVEIWHRTYGSEFLARWLAQLQATNDRTALRCPDTPPELWSALTDTPIRAEALPETNASDMEMKHYWETSHFRRHLGDDVQRQIFKGQKPQWVVAERLHIKTTTTGEGGHVETEAHSWLGGYPLTQIKNEVGPIVSTPLFVPEH